MKMTRHAKIKEIIDNNKIETQEDLASALRHQGIDVTQATVSRDIKELMRSRCRMPTDIITMLIRRSTARC